LPSNLCLIAHTNEGISQKTGIIRYVYNKKSMTVSVKKYDIPKQKLGATEAKSLAKEIEPIEEHAEKLIDKKIQDKSVVPASKQDIADLEVRLNTTVYFKTAVQLAALSGSVSANVKFMS